MHEIRGYSGQHIPDSPAYVRCNVTESKRIEAAYDGYCWFFYARCFWCHIQALHTDKHVHTHALTMARRTLNHRSMHFSLLFHPFSCLRFCEYTVFILCYELSSLCATSYPIYFALRTSFSFYSAACHLKNSRLLSCCMRSFAFFHSASISHFASRCAFHMKMNEHTLNQYYLYIYMIIVYARALKL